MNYCDVSLKCKIFVPGMMWKHIVSYYQWFVFVVLLIFLLYPLIFLIILGEVGQYDSEVARLQVPGSAGQAFLDR